jgi:formylglycine-generating enzyme required for sulfatase activity
LPTEAEWEYACRAGSTTIYYFGEEESQLGEYGWYRGNSGLKTNPVGIKKPNRWGLYDMAGNVWESCQDGYGNYPGSDQVDPGGLPQAAERVVRGGGWSGDSDRCRSAARGKNPPSGRSGNLGCRLALIPSG